MLNYQRVASRNKSNPGSDITRPGLFSCDLGHGAALIQSHPGAGKPMVLTKTVNSVNSYRRMIQSARRQLFFFHIKFLVNFVRRVNHHMSVGIFTWDDSHIVGVLVHDTAVQYPCIRVSHSRHIPSICSLHVLTFHINGRHVIRMGLPPIFNINMNDFTCLMMFTRQE